MFKNILIPISSEFYPIDIFEKGSFLADKFNSKITLMYIIEEKILNKTDKLINSFRTQHEREITKNEIIQTYKKTADSIVFDDARYFFNKNIDLDCKIVKGSFSKAVKNELNNDIYDLILMGFEKECILNYNLLNEVDVPIWINSKEEGRTILGICSNLAPNKKVPDFSIKLAKILNWDLHMIYVIDKFDNVQVDQNGIRSKSKNKHDLIINGKNFIKKMEKKGIKINLVNGILERETAKAANNIKADLVIVGREQKRKNVFGFPSKNFKRKIAEKCDYSVLFVN